MDNFSDYEKQMFSQIENFVQKYRPTLYILTPCYGGMCYASYTSSIIKTVRLFETLKFPLIVQFCRNESLITRARNNLISKAMKDNNMTHVMFIDSDISWEPISILKLILSEKPLIGGVYPLKYYFFDKLYQNNMNNMNEWLHRRDNIEYLKQVSNEDMIRCNLLNYNVIYNDTSMNIINDLAEVKYIATGFMMIRRETIEKMIDAFPDTKYTNDPYMIGFEGDAYALFDTGIVNRVYCSEDWMFCNRWKQIGGSIFIDVSISLTHTGTEEYKGCYIGSMNISK